MIARIAAALAMLAGCDALFRVDAIGSESDAALADASHPNGLLAHYAFDTIGTTSCAIDSLGGHDGDCIMGKPVLVAGKHDNAFYFDGTTAIEIAHANELDATSAFTVAVWLSVAGSTGAVQCPVNRPYGAGSLDSWQLCLTLTNTGAFYFSDALVTTSPLSLTAYHHVALTWDGTTATAWLDGAMQTQATPAAPAYDGNGIYIGMDVDGGMLDVGFFGSLDDLYIYNRALAPAEIAALAM
jgi:hypothetical protein